MEIEAEDLFEQRGQRIHCDRKIYGNRRLFTGPDLVRKNVLWHKSFEGVENYINPENGQVNSYFEENMPPLKDLELDPFAMSNFVVPYSANKKKRWMIEELLAENVEEYQTETMCVSGLTQVLTALDNDIENYCVESPSNILIDVQATAFHEVVDGVPSHEYTTHKLTREVLRIPNRIPTIEDVESGEAFQEDGAYYRPPRHDYGGKIHLVYLTMKTDKRTTRINANKKISRLGSKGREDMPDFWALFFGLVEEKKTKKVVKSKKRSLVPALEDYSSLDAASEEDFPSEEETEESHSHRSSIHDLRDYIVPMVTKKKRRKHKKTKAFEDYRPVLPEVLRKETEEESTTSIPEDSAPSNVKVELLQKIVSDEVDISDGVALLPMYPFIATMKQRSGDVLVLRDGALYLNPKPEDVDESYRFCAVKLQANILLDLKTIDSMSAGPHLQVLEPRDAEKLALDLYRAEEEALRTKNFNDVAKPSVECPICLGEEFQFALSACGHFSCVDCWSNYAAHAIHDNRVPLRCFAEKCSEVLPIPVLLSFVHQAFVRLYEKQLANRRLLQDNFFSCKRCEKFLYAASGTSAKILVCECGFGICRECREEAHVPLSCEGMRKYEDFLKRNGQSFHDSSESYVANGVKCPKCASLVDRTEGCNHMSCICGYEFCYACRRRFTGSHYECENEGRKDFALIDGSDTIHPVVFGWCSDIRNRKQPKILKDMRRYLAMKNEDECLVTRYEQIVDFVERCVVHRYFKRKKINIEMSDVPSQQFLSALERFIFCMRRPDSGRFEDVRLKKVVDLGIVLCDLMSTACQRM